MSKFSSPKCVRVLSVLALVFSVLWIVAYILCVVFQNQIKPLFISSPEAAGWFIFPVTPLVSNAVLLIVISVFAILLLAFGQKSVWAVWISAVFLGAVVFANYAGGFIGALCSVFDSMQFNQYGTMAVASYTALNSVLGYVGFLISAAYICMLTALGILTHHCAFEAKMQKNEYGRAMM